jgi:translation initiation factor 2B subunit (eIF-2B alpha/beta/delta family)
LLTTSISSAVYKTLVEASNLLANTSTGTSSRSTAGTAKEGTPAANGVPLSVIVCESRPLCEGVTLACQLSAAGLNTTVITDAQAYISLQDVGAVLLGCDAITQEGPVNKVGSALLALAAQSKGIPVVVVGDSLKVSPGPVMAACLPYVLGGGLTRSGGAAQHTVGEDTSGQPHTTLVQGAAEAQEEEMDWKELSGAWKAADAAEVTQALAAAEQQQQHAPGRARSGALNVRNVYFEAVPWSLVDRLVVETGALDEAGVAAQLGQQHTVYTAAFQLTLLAAG